MNARSTSLPNLSDDEGYDSNFSGRTRKDSETQTDEEDSDRTRRNSETQTHEEDSGRTRRNGETQTDEEYSGRTRRNGETQTDEEYSGRTRKNSETQTDEEDDRDSGFGDIDKSFEKTDAETQTPKWKDERHSKGTQTKTIKKVDRGVQTVKKKRVRPTRKTTTDDDTDLIPTELRDLWSQITRGRSTLIYPNKFFGRPRQPHPTERTSSDVGREEKTGGEDTLIPSKLRNRWSQITRGRSTLIFPKKFFGHPLQPKQSDWTGEDGRRDHTTGDEGTLIPADLKDRWSQITRGRSTLIFPKKFFGRPIQPKQSDWTREDGRRDQTTGDEDTLIPADLRYRWSQITRGRSTLIFPKQFFGRPLQPKQSDQIREDGRREREEPTGDKDTLIPADLKDRWSQITRGRSTLIFPKKFFGLPIQPKQSDWTREDGHRDQTTGDEDTLIPAELKDRWSQITRGRSTLIFPKKFFGCPIQAKQSDWTREDVHRDQTTGDEDTLIPADLKNHWSQITRGRSTLIFPKKFFGRPIQPKQSDWTREDGHRDQTSGDADTLIPADLKDRWSQITRGRSTLIFPKKFFGYPIQPKPSDWTREDGHRDQTTGDEDTLIPAELKDRWSQITRGRSTLIFPKKFFGCPIQAKQSDWTREDVRRDQTTGGEDTLIPAELKDRWSQIKSGRSTLIFPKTFFGRPIQTKPSGRKSSPVGRTGKGVTRNQMTDFMREVDIQHPFRNWEVSPKYKWHTRGRVPSDWEQMMSLVRLNQRRRQQKEGKSGDPSRNAHFGKPTSEDFNYSKDSGFSSGFDSEFHSGFHSEHNPTDNWNRETIGDNDFFYPKTFFGKQMNW